MYPLRLYLRHRANLISFILSLSLNLFIWAWLLFYIRKQDYPLFLHYTVLFGVDYTGEWYKVFSVPLGGLCILLINFFLGWILFHKDDFAGILLNAITVFIQVIFLVTAVLLVFLNV